MKPSLKFQLAELLINLIGAKKVFQDRKRAYIYMRKKAVENEKKVNPPLFISKRAQRFQIENMDYFFIKRKSKTIVLYIHGGAFVAQPNLAHWLFFQKLQRNTRTSIVMPIYPKAPTYDYTHTYPKLFALYKHLLKTYPNSKFIFMGDSAGGNIALSFALQLKQNNLPLPSNIIVFSPCLDLALENKQAYEIDKQGIDPMLSIEGLKAMYEAWAGNADLKNPIVSPFYADLKNIEKATIFIGTHEILYPEAVEFTQKAKKEGVNLNLIIEEKMNHVYPFFPTREAKRARRIIYKLVQEK